LTTRPRPTSPQNRVRPRPRAASFPVALVLLLACAGQVAAQTGPDGDRPDPGTILVGLDPLLAATDDPRLLGPGRLIWRERLLAQGIDPLREPVAPSLRSNLKEQLLQRIAIDLEREEVQVEANGASGLYTRIRYPSWFFLFPTPRKLPGGFSYYPPRPVDAPDVDLFVDDLATARERDWQLLAARSRLEDLDTAGGGRRAGRDEGLINLTIPIKLPRTLEAIIGRGDKTNIKITGREHIAIRGETTRSNQFTPTERVQSQSWFPDLDMEQQLQVNLTGQIGEKIFIEVDHNSEAIGPEATKIKLEYRGDEDEIIQSIETGDVGLTLPGGQLLGYQGNKQGLFGVKVTGQFGPADFTVVASKQKAESDSKSFNSKGGEVTEHVIPSWNYLNNRFFRLDLPALGADGHEQLGYFHPDVPGRASPSEYGGNQRIDPTTVRVYRKLGSVAAQPGDAQYVAATLDTTGVWDQPYIDQKTVDDYDYGTVWRPVPVSFLRDASDNIIAVDLGSQMPDDEILAVTYDVVNTQTGALAYRVGEDPNNEDPGNPGALRGLTIGEQGYYRMKLLKPAQPERFSFQYVLRNIYPLGGTGIDSESFELRIETTDTSRDNPDQHGTQGLLFLQLFGLDSETPQGQPTPDGVVDKHIPELIDLQRGLLKFPLNFPFPFDATEEAYRQNAGLEPGDPRWEWNDTILQATRTPEIYDHTTLPNDYDRFGTFRLVATHAAASSVINLGVSNIEEGSETVTLDGRTLVKGEDYEIDYLFGTVELKGQAAGQLQPDSNIQVNYQYAPFFGGGQSSLLGLNLGYDLGRDSKLSTTWLYQSKSIVGNKAKLGEEPSRTLVGNLNLNHTVRSDLLTDFSNLFALKNRENPSTLEFRGEAAISIPNPNTRDKAYLEDFEGAANTDVVTLGRLGWYRASRPVDPATGLLRGAVQRLSDIRWYTPETRVLRRWLNPELQGQERDETQQAITLYLREEAGWVPESWGGIMRGLSRTGLDLSKAQFIEIWVNDAEQNPADRRGKLHIDFGTISEDFVWPADQGTGELVFGTEQQEDLNVDGIFNVATEDVGLDAVLGAGNAVIERGAEYSAERSISGQSGPYPAINNTAGNNYEDSEDIDGDDQFNTRNSYFTVTIDLAETEPLVDVAVDYPEAELQGTSWRKYRIRLSEDQVRQIQDGGQPSIAAVKHLRIWYEDDADGAPQDLTLQLSELQFLGSRWEREGLRKASNESLLDSADLGPDEAFFIGEINNKDNPDYNPPFPVRSENDIPEKETALVVDFTSLGAGHMLRTSKQVSAQGDDYTRYNTLSWWWHCPDADVADLDVFYRIGADSTNYYQVGTRFVDIPERSDWVHVNLDIAELTNIKNNPRDADGIIRGEIADKERDVTYQVEIRGRPDLRRVTRFAIGVANNTRRAITGQFWFNDIILLGAKREIGIAQSLGGRLNLGDVLKVDADWNRRDAEFHGLNEEVGQGAVTESWNMSTNFRVDDFLPMLGFQLPVSLSRQQSTSRPKYEINSDVEILDEDRRNRFSSVEDRESFSVRLSRRQSRAAIPRYLLDPWNVQLSGSRTSRDTPTESADQTNLQGSVNYNLQLQSDPQLGDLPVLSAIPLVRGLSLLPRRVEGAASFTSTDRTSTRRDLDGTTYPATEQQTRPGTLTSGFEYRPFNWVTANYKNRSERDLLRRQEWNGINIGEENKYSQDLTLTFTPIKGSELPQAAIYAPLRWGVRALNDMRTSLTFQGSFVNDHGPSVRQPTDPPDVRNISNGNDWQFRAQLPLGDVFEDLVPEPRRTGGAQSALDQEIQLIRREALADTTLQFRPDRVQRFEEMTLEEQREAEDEWYREQAIDRMREEGRELPDEGGGVGPRQLVEPLFSVLRGFDPISVSYTRSRTSGFGRLRGADVPLSYKLGFLTDPTLPDTAYVVLRQTENDNLTLSTKTRLTREIQLDVKYGLTESSTKTLDSQTWSYNQDWPDLRLNFTGLEGWGIFGGQPDDREAGWFRSSSIDVAYKHTKSVPSYTETQHNPRRSTTITPRWNMTFHSGMSLSLNGSLARESQTSSGTLTDTRRVQVGLQLQHEFEAQTFLAKMGLYQAGSRPVINMTIDLRYQRNTTDRQVPGAVFEQGQQGTQNISLQPRFSYNISKNLSGAFSLNFSQNKNLATDLTTTTIGLGLEATFVF